MADDSPAPPAPQRTESTHAVLSPRGIDITHGDSGRQELIVQARAFLTSPQVAHEDNDAKRRFLIAKGLTELEINGLINELPPSPPIVPARTYPQPLPSNLPNLLIGAARILTWLAGGTAAILAVYFRFILPRLTRSYQARHALQSHQRALYDRLQLSLLSHKEIQATDLRSLPKADRFKEEAPFVACNTPDALLVSQEGLDEPLPVPNVSLLRCAINDCTADLQREPTSEELFDALQAKIPSLAQDDAGPQLNTLWEILNTAPIFRLSSATDDKPSTWSHSPAPEPSPAPLLTSLSSLKSSLPTESDETRKSTQHHTLQALADFTGYLTTHAYALSLPSSSRPMFGMDSKLEPAADEVRREIRALKGLVLNRRSFMPPSPAPAAASASSLIF